MLSNRSEESCLTGFARRVRIRLALKLTDMFFFFFYKEETFLNEGESNNSIRLGTATPNFDFRLLFMSSFSITSSILLRPFDFSQL